MASPKVPHAAVVPAIAENRSHRIVPYLQELSDVVGLILDPFVIVRPSRAENRVTHAVTVQMQLVEPLGGSIQRCASDCLVDLKTLAQVRTRLHSNLDRWPSIQADPQRSPISSHQQPHLPPSRRAVRGGLPVLVAHAYFPPAVHTRPQLLAYVNHVRGLIRVHATAVPLRAAIGLQVVETRSDQNLVS